MSETAYQKCIHADCGETFDIGQPLFGCPKCGNLLDVAYDWDKVSVPKSLDTFNRRWTTPGRSVEARADFSGVWRFRELLPFATVEEIATIGEGRTILQQADQIAKQIGMKSGRLFLQYEGFNPTGSFKDNGMTAAFTIARKLDRSRVACASTGNTSAAMSVYAAHSGDSGKPMQAIVFVGEGKIAFGKLAQALDYGALTLQIAGDFDACMKRAVECAQKLDVYLMNSLNPFRLEGQKTIMFRILEGLDWQVPDWIIVPGGNLGNSSAFGKAFMELHALGLIPHIPRIAIINAAGASTLDDAWNNRKMRWNDGKFDSQGICEYFDELDAAHKKAKTVASAIEIGRPVNLAKGLRTLDVMNGIVRTVTDDEILACKAMVGRYGYGCEPASAASLAGLIHLREEGMIGPDDKVACVLTGHALKDPDATVNYHMKGSDQGIGSPPNQPVQVADDFEAIKAAIAATA
ncbi:MAG: threonine synthase [Phycisphaerales bacterium]|nr:threonine synthase [Phycisphaerales bacterium]